MSIRVVIAEDEPAFRSALQKTLALMPECEILGACKDGQEALDVCLAEAPDVLLTDINMPRLTGIELMQKVLKSQRDMAVVVLTTHEDDDTVYQAFRLGALGYLLKTSTPHDVIDAVRCAAKGEAKITPSIATRVLVDFRRFRESEQEVEGADLYDLSERESQILGLVATGLRNRDIAEQLDIAEKTVKNHVSNILKALQVNSRTEAAMIAVKQGLGQRA